MKNDDRLRAKLGSYYCITKCEFMNIVLLFYEHSLMQFMFELNGSRVAYREGSLT